MAPRLRPAAASRFCSLWLLGALASSPQVTAAESAATSQAAGDELAVMPVVLDLTRPSDTDILMLRNGDKLTGTVLNESFSIRTSYAHIKLNNRMIAGIDLEGGANNIEAVVTVNSNRFSGFLDDAVFVFRLQGGANIQVRREKVLKVVFRMREQERTGIPQRQFLILKNGDYFSGRVKNESVSVVTTYAKIPVKLSDAETVAFIGGENVLTKITLLNEDTVQGVLETEDIEVDLDVGDSVQVYKDRIDRMYCRDGFVPDFAALIAGPSGRTLALDLGGGVTMELVLIPAGEFMMGSPPGESERSDDEGPQHKVGISKPFYLGKYEVTQAQWKAVMGGSPSKFKGDELPVEQVSWEDSQRFCRKLAEKVGHEIRLPTEAEWEHACRAGSTTAFCFGEGSDELGGHAWYANNAGKKTRPVGGKRPNAFGLYDMHGNVWEWCQDWYAKSHYGSSPPEDPKGPSSGDGRVLRGGAWSVNPAFCRSALRYWYAPGSRNGDIGFRVCSGAP